MTQKRSFKSLNSFLLIGLLIMFLPLIPEAQQDLPYDILFINGKLMDGTGNPWFYGDVGIKSGKITKIGRSLDRTSAEKVIDITGKVIAPGFIDIHTHAYDRISSDKVWVDENEKRFFAPNYISQGVTTVVSNQCGTSPLSIKKQKDILISHGIGPNTVLLIGHNSVRRAVMKNDFQRTATSKELDKMKILIRQAMSEGAFGMSSGLEYVPAIWSDTEELVALVKEIVPWDGIFQVHERASGLSPMWFIPSQHEPGPPNMLENIEELITVAERTGARIIATHIKARGKNFWGASQTIIKLIQDARNRGLDIWADCYPYNSSGSDGNTQLLPSWALGKDFPSGLQKTLLDPVKRKALFMDVKHAINWRGGTENILVMDHPDKSYIGKTIAQVAAAEGLSDLDMIIKLQMEGYPKRPGGARLRGFSMDEIDIEAFSSQPWTCTSSDGSITLPADGPVHTRFYGTFPRKISHYAIKKKIMTLENAIRASTSLPAQILGLRDRGLLREGFHADIVVFDPQTIKDTATFFKPHQYAQGIEYVLVNGKFALSQGELTWERSGRVLSK